MAATFRTRPWRLVPSRPTATLLSPFLVGAPRLLAPTTGQTRYYAMRLDPQLRNQKTNASRHASKQQASQTLMKEMMSEKNFHNSSDMVTLAPGTIANIPWYKGLAMLEHRPADYFTYYFYVIRQRIGDRIQMIYNSARAKGGYFARGRPDYKAFKPSRKGIIETALDLHAKMSRSVASGRRADQKQLAEICVPKLCRSLLGLIESRRPGRSYKWEMTELTGYRTWPRRLSWLRWLTWPRIVDYKWTEMPIGPGKSLEFRQAVVGIKSRQKLTELDAHGRVVGVPKEMVLTEYLVLWRMAETRTKTLGPWLISGTLKETSLKDLKEEFDTINSLGKLMSEESLNKKRKQKGLQGG